VRAVFTYSVLWNGKINFLGSSDNFVLGLYWYVVFFLEDFAQHSLCCVLKLSYMTTRNFPFLFDFLISLQYSGVYWTTSSLSQSRKIVLWQGCFGRFHCQLPLLVNVASKVTEIRFLLYPGCCRKECQVLGYRRCIISYVILQ
jgi:hypothetical protein